MNLSHNTILKWTLFKQLLNSCVQGALWPRLILRMHTILSLLPRTTGNIYNLSEKGVTMNTRAYQMALLVPLDCSQKS